MCVFFSVSGPFVLRDSLVLFQMLTPGSDIDFCSAFHVNWWGGGAGLMELKLLKLPQINHLKDLKVLISFGRWEGALLKLLWKVEDLTVGFSWFI